MVFWLWVFIVFQTVSHKFWQGWSSWICFEPWCLAMARIQTEDGPEPSQWVLRQGCNTLEKWLGSWGFRVIDSFSASELLVLWDIPWRIRVWMVDWCDNMTGVFVDGKWHTIFVAYIRIRHGIIIIIIIHQTGDNIYSLWWFSWWLMVFLMMVNDNIWGVPTMEGTPILSLESLFHGQSHEHGWWLGVPAFQDGIFVGLFPAIVIGNTIGIVLGKTISLGLALSNCIYWKPVGKSWEYWAVYRSIPVFEKGRFFVGFGLVFFYWDVNGI